VEADLVDLNRPISPAARLARRESSLMRGINGDLRRRSEALADSELIAFFCECRNASCFSPVWLSPRGFDVRVADGRGWLLLDGHDASALWHRREPLPSRELTPSAGVAADLHPAPPTRMLSQAWPRLAARRRVTRSAALRPVPDATLNRLESTKQ
jgi:hypothetical protein